MCLHWVLNEEDLPKPIIKEVKEFNIIEDIEFAKSKVHW